MNVITIGGAMVDTIAIIDSQLIEKMTMSNSDKSFLLLEQGKKTEALSVSTHCGGGAINAAVAFSRLGFDVSTLVKLGEDDRAALVLDTLMREGVADRWVKRSIDHPTGASAVVSSHDRNAAIFTFRGANTLLAPADLTTEMFQSRVVYVAALSDNSADCLPRIVSLARANNCFLVVNPGIRQIKSRFAALRDHLPDVDLIAVNRHEATILAGHGVVNDLFLRDLADESLAVADVSDRHASARILLRGLSALGGRSVLLTDGNRGAYALADGKIAFCSALRTEVVGTAGAGDAFISTFTAYRVLGHDVSDALKAASLNANSVVQFADAQTGLLNMSSLVHRMGEVSGECTIECTIELFEIEH